MTITITQIVTIVTIAAGLWAMFFGRGLLDFLPRKNRYQFNNARIFLIEIEPTIYQLGIIARIFNLLNNNQEVEEITIKGGELGIMARAPFQLQTVYNRVGTTKILEDNVVIANSPTYIKLLLPIKLQIHNFNTSITPEILFFGEWCIKSSRGMFRTACGNMKHYATYEKYISFTEWEKLLKPSSSINIEDISLKLAPVDVDLLSSTKLYLVWNSDPTAKINIYGFSESVYVKAANGTMVFVAGNGKLNLENGWQILGSNYKEVWANPQKLFLYNSIYPPSESGEPLAFAAFIGAEELMGVNAPVPTTRAATFLHIPLLDPMEWAKGKTKGKENIRFTPPEPSYF